MAEMRYMDMAGGTGIVARFVSAHPFTETDMMDDPDAVIYMMLFTMGTTPKEKPPIIHEAFGITVDPTLSHPLETGWVRNGEFIPDKLS